MIRPISLGTRLGLGVPCGAPEAAAPAFSAEVPTAVAPALLPWVVEVGPARSPAVFDACAGWLGAPSAVLGAALLVLAAEAELVPPLQAVAARRIKTRIYRYIFPNCCKR